MIFGLISEGPSDQILLRKLLGTYLVDPNIDFRPLVPKESEKVAGWSKVLNYLKADEFKDSFDYVDYLIIQIDTDVYHKWPENGVTIKASNEKKEQTVIEQIINVQEYLVKEIGNDFYKEYNKRIIFAVSVQSIECWLLPFYSNKPAHQKKIVNCTKTLNTQYLNPAFGYTIDADLKTNNDGVHYDRATEIIKDRKKLKKVYKLNTSLKVFIESLNQFFKLSPELKIVD